MYTQYMYEDSLTHHGILGMKWGVRRYQNPDGTLTAEGRRRYAPRSTDSAITRGVKRDLANLTEAQWRAKYYNSKARYMKGVDKYGDPYMNAPLTKIGKKLNAKNAKNKKLDKNRQSYLKGEIGKQDYKKSKDEIKEEYKRRKKAIDAGKPDAFVDKYSKEELKLLIENPKGRGSSRKEVLDLVEKSVNNSKKSNVPNKNAKESLTENQKAYLEQHPDLEPVYLNNGTFFGYQNKDPKKRRW